MKKLQITCLIFLVASFASTASVAIQAMETTASMDSTVRFLRTEFVSREVLVKYKAWVETAAGGDIEQKFQLNLLSYRAALNVYCYQVPEDQEVHRVVAELSSDPAVEFAEPNYLYCLSLTPNDSLYANYRDQAGRMFPNSLQRWVFNGAGTDRNSNGEAAWDLTTGRNDVVIAIIDSGVLLNHPDLRLNIWRNPGEAPGNGIDDDGNGFIDDVNGWDFRGKTSPPEAPVPDNDPNPDFGDGVDNNGDGRADEATSHGTFVAGIAGARGNDGVGIAGTCWNCRLMALKVTSDEDGASSLHIAEAILYAANNGANVISLGFTASRASQTVRDAINIARARGVVFVAGAGNGNSAEPQFPASFDHVISVGATDYGGDLPITIDGRPVTPDLDGRASLSQFGPGAVDVVAPGIVFSTSVLSVADERQGMGRAGESGYRLGAGTSASAAMVAGLAALIISRARDLNQLITNEQVEAIIRNTAKDLADDPDDSPDAGSDWDGRGRADMRAALNTLSVPPDCSVEPVMASNRAGTNHAVTVTVRQYGIPTSGISILFNVTSGPNAGKNASRITDDSGQARFTYTSNGLPGIDTIVASGTVGNSRFTCTSTSIWVATPIEFGQTIVASIESMGEKDAYAFQAAAGDVVRVRMSSGAIDPQIELFDGQGKRLGAAALGSDVFLDLRLESGGTFFFLLSDHGGDHNGPYAVSLQRLNNPAGAKAIQFGETVAASIDALAEMDAYSFQAAAGDVVRVRMSSGAIDPQIELLDAQGKRLGTATSGSDVFLDLRLESGGTFFFLLSDRGGNHKGAYGVSLQRLNNPAGAKAIRFGETVAATIDALAEMDAYSFQAAAGDVVRVRMSSAAIDPQIELFDGQGKRLGTATSGSDVFLDLRLESGGTFFFLLSDRGGNHKGPYAVSLQRLNNPAARELQLRDPQVVAAYARK